MTSTKPSTDYTTTLTVKKSPEKVYNAINNVSGWWIGDVVGKADKVGSEFTYAYKEYHNTTQKLSNSYPIKESSGSSQNQK